MLRSDTLFGKQSNALNSSLNTANTPGQANATLSRTAPGPSSAAASPESATPAASPDISTATGRDESGSKLIVGPNIKLKGVEITDCDTIVVEGFVEATIYSRVIQISEQGAFKGAAEIDIAEIRGVFDGDLTVRHKLVIFSTGKVSGKIRYGKLVIEEGGQLSGDVQMDGPGNAKPAIVSRTSSDPVRAPLLASSAGMVS